MKKNQKKPASTRVLESRLVRGFASTTAPESNDAIPFLYICFDGGVSQGPLPDLPPAPESVLTNVGLQILRTHAPESALALDDSLAPPSSQEPNPPQDPPENSTRRPGFFKRAANYVRQVADYAADTRAYNRARFFNRIGKDYYRPSWMDVLTQGHWNTIPLVQRVDEWFYDHRKALSNTAFACTVALIPGLFALVHYQENHPTHSSAYYAAQSTPESKQTKTSDSKKEIEPRKDLTGIIFEEARAGMHPQLELSIPAYASALATSTAVASTPPETARLLESQLALPQVTADPQHNARGIAQAVLDPSSSPSGLSTSYNTDAASTSNQDSSEHIALLKYHPRTGDTVSEIAQRVIREYHLETPVYGEGGLVELIQTRNHLDEVCTIYADNDQVRAPLEIPLPYETALTSASQSYANGMSLKVSMAPYKSLKSDDVQREAYRIAAQEGKALKFNLALLPEEYRNIDERWAEQKRAGMTTKDIVAEFNAGIGAKNGMSVSDSTANRYMSKHF
jgi:hypothetical protein